MSKSHFNPQAVDNTTAILLPPVERSTRESSDKDNITNKNQELIRSTASSSSANASLQSSKTILSYTPSSRVTSFFTRLFITPPPSPQVSPCPSPKSSSEAFVPDMSIHYQHFNHHLIEPAPQEAEKLTPSRAP